MPKASCLVSCRCGNVRAMADFDCAQLQTQPDGTWAGPATEFFNNCTKIPRLTDETVVSYSIGSQVAFLSSQGYVCCMFSHPPFSYV